MGDTTSDDRKPLLLVEQTERKYTAIRCVGIGVLIGSFSAGYATITEFGDGKTVLTAIGTIVGIMIFGIGAGLSWWHNG